MRVVLSNKYDSKMCKVIRAFATQSVYGKILLFFVMSIPIDANIIVDNSRDSSPPDNAESASFAAFELFKSYLDRKLDTFKRDITQDSDQKSQDIAKKLKLEHSYQFKYEGNKKQYEFNDHLNSEVLKIARAAEKRDFSSVQKLCDEISKEIHRRNKCIKLADKSPAGWETVKEYLSDDLASDSEDEKRIRAAESRAMRARKQKKSLGVRKSDSRPSTQASRSDATSGSVSNPFRPYRKYVSVAKSTDVCFACNEKGHWRKDCQKINKQSQ
ncbi:hypothetical protein FSP39_020415 [Pinctada imbricata]|uniref:CCHC-type domain-containing protein n=1 Tax=Pinctada imbricata TaxID=66713 RepID=A0AA89C9D4_PINIB|nr:hypothetical protein FSP39_020415 [Pinctada imbricata]